MLVMAGEEFRSRLDASAALYVDHVRRAGGDAGAAEQTRPNL